MRITFAQTHDPVVCKRINSSADFHTKSWSYRFECPTCGMARRYNTNFLGNRNRLVCNGAKIVRVHRDKAPARTDTAGDVLPSGGQSAAHVTAPGATGSIPVHGTDGSVTGRSGDVQSGRSPVHADLRRGERRKRPNAAAHLARVIAEDAPLVPRGDDRRVLPRQQWNDPGRRAGGDRRRPWRLADVSRGVATVVLADGDVAGQVVLHGEHREGRWFYYWVGGGRRFARRKSAAEYVATSWRKA